ncbi:MAG: hypothetical protein KGN33_18380 [Paracoccaceae bacterium]|nr:hypothetical protein [Paracoccaceae bacterium]
MHDFTTLEGQAALVIGAGRRLAAQLRHAGLARLSLDVPVISHGLDDLAEGQALEPGIEKMFRVLTCLLRQHRDHEILDRVQVFVGIHDPEEGDIGDVEEWVVLTDRGLELQGLLESVETVLTQRQQLLDRFSAQQFVSDRLCRGA